MSAAQTFADSNRPTEVARLELVRLPSDLPLAAVFARACEVSARALEVERVSVWLYVDDRTALRCVNLYERSRNEHSPGAVLRVADFPVYFSALSVRKAVPAEFAVADPRTAELASAYLNPLGIHSLLDAGIYVGNDLVGVVCHEHVGSPREWTTEARDFAGSVADLLAVRYQTAAVADLKSALRAQAARQAMIEKTEAIERMAAGLANDFRQLLDVVTASGGRLAARTDLRPEARSEVNQLLAAAGRGADLAGEMLTFAKPTPHPPTVYDLTAITNGFLPVLAASVGPRYRLRYDPPEAVGLVLIDKGEYTQILHNLTVNACEALPNGGDVCVRVSPVRLASRTGPSEHYVMLEVADRGVGMDEDTRRKACDSFFSTKPTRTGLGLAVVRRAADRAGGFVRIKSEPGQGTSVRVFFPRVAGGGGGTMELPALPTEPFFPGKNTGAK